MSEQEMPKPKKIESIAILVMINGILNIFGGIAFFILMLLMSFGLYIFCTPFLILPIILGIFEIIYASNLLTIPTKVEKPSQILAVFEILCVFYGNIISFILGVVHMVLMNDQEVVTYFSAVQE